jgi:hypothetical protein
VGSEAAVKLTTRAFAELKANPKIGRAEAFRRSMRELIEKDSPAEAYPAMWAPFVVIGEGGASAAPLATQEGSPDSPSAAKDAAAHAKGKALRLSAAPAIPHQFRGTLPRS